jgi:type IV pilus assembly protein PilM
MIQWIKRTRPLPIGVDLGTRSVKLVQFGSAGDKTVTVARQEMPPLPEKATPEQAAARLTDGLQKALAARTFRGREAVVCLNDRHLHLQSLRVTRQSGAELDHVVAQEAAGRLPFGLDEAEIRYIESADVRQGDALLREVVVFACQRSVLQAVLDIVERARLTPIAVDVEPSALVRSYAGQFRRDDDAGQRAMMIHIGSARTTAVIAQGDEMLFVKYIELGGQHFDAAVARHLKMELDEAAALRKHNGDRRSDMQDPEITRSVSEAMRPVVDRIGGELAMCVRYHSVTFRGQPLTRMVLGGGEATPALVASFSTQLDLPCELSDPFRSFTLAASAGRRGLWDVAAGLALRPMN